MRCFHEQEDPRYRVRYFPEQAAFEDLLAVILSHGNPVRNVRELSQDLAQLAGSEAGLFELEAGAIAGIKGMGQAKVACILAAVELARRKTRRDVRAGESLEPEVLARWLAGRLQGFGNEYLYLFNYNRKFRLIQRHQLSRGNPDMVQTYMRDTVKIILNDRASYTIIAHNHPEETARPSLEDLRNMEDLEELLRPLGVTLLDQYITGTDGVYSCRRENFLCPAAREESGERETPLQKAITSPER